jgi:DNA polymerase-3 subunit epsilon
VNYTHEIVRMERGETSGSKSPMWRCTTKDGQRVNAFQHLDPKKDSSGLFIEAGYFDLMSGLKVGEALEWTNHPIQVALVSDGKWFEIKAVARKPEDAEPDVLWQPDLKAYRQRAQRMALQIVNHAVRILDVETTGLRTDDELIAISIFDEMSNVMMDTYVKPAHPEKLLRKQKDGQSAADITGITPDMLENTRCFKDIWDDLHGALDGAHWCAYNAGFDVGVLDRECSNAGRPLLTNAGVFDAAIIAAEYLGNWNPKRQWFEMLKLGEAASRLGVHIEVQHQAGSDAKATYDILKAIADDVLGDPF